MRHWNILSRDVLGARTGVQGRAGARSEQPHLAVGRCPCSLQGSGTRCSFRVPFGSNDSMILQDILMGRTPVDTRNKHCGMRAEMLHRAAATAPNILTLERQQGSQRVTGRPLVPPGTSPSSSARGPAGEEQRGCETSLSQLRHWGHEEPKPGRADSTTALAQPMQMARSWWAVCGHSKAHGTVRSTNKPTAHLENSFSEVLFP